MSQHHTQLMTRYRIH